MAGRIIALSLGALLHGIAQGFSVKDIWPTRVRDDIPDWSLLVEDPWRGLPVRKPNLIMFIVSIPEAADA